jgi:hypothetical protein
MIDLSGGRPGRRIVWGAAVGAALVAMAAILLTMSATAGAGKHRVAAEDQFLKAISVPIKLRAPGDPPGIRFDISCLPPDGNAEGAGSCDGGGTVYFRTSSGISASAPLVLDPSVQVGRYVASVPASIWAASAFTYYAVIRDNTTGRTIVVPPGGSSAPQVSFAMSGPSIDLDAHTFGSPRQASARVASAGWGGGDQQVGLEDGVDMPTGAASFDVDPAGDVYLLDEAHARMLEFPVGGPPQTIALPGLAGVKADLRVSDASGTAYVLEVANAAAPRPLLRSFTLQGGALTTTTVADDAAAQVRLSGSTAYVSEYPSSMWAPVLQANGLTPVDPSLQLARAFPGAPAKDGNVVVLSTGNEIRVATYSVSGAIYRFSSVRITSTTPVADIQLAQRLPSGRLLVVFSVYTDSEHEYEAVLIDPSGRLVDQFSLPAPEWAQSMPLSRFRLAGSSIYELGSTDQGAFVDRYDLEVS